MVYIILELLFNFYFCFICTDQIRYPIKYKCFRDTKYQDDADRIGFGN